MLSTCFKWRSFVNVALARVVGARGVEDQLEHLGLCLQWPQASMPEARRLGEKAWSNSPDSNIPQTQYRESTLCTVWGDMAFVPFFEPYNPLQYVDPSLSLTSATVEALMQR